MLRRKTKRMVNALFITFEGLDGSGKSLMIYKIAGQLRQQGRRVFTTREPGGTKMGRQLRQLILGSAYGSMDERTEALLYAADRALHVSQVIRPALQEGKIVLCDRYIDSSFAYQGSGRGIAIEQIRAINLFAIDNLMPDITFLLDLPVEEALGRLRGRRDRLEQEDTAFFARTAAAYRQLAAQDSQRFVLIDAARSIPEVQQQIMDTLTERLK